MCRMSVALAAALLTGLALSGCAYDHPEGRNHAGHRGMMMKADMDCRDNDRANAASDHADHEKNEPRDARDGDHKMSGCRMMSGKEGGSRREARAPEGMPQQEHPPQ